MTHPGYKLFERSADLYEAAFVERPNRFVVRGALGGHLVDAHCPNPGRLLEILLPGTTLLLQKRPDHGERLGKTGARLPYSLVAARHRGILVPLAPARANDLAEQIVLPLLFPEAGAVRREVALGRSRLDFRIDLGNRSGSRTSALPGFGELYLEVKACTLVEEGTAMFPDAPTLRGLKHLEELEALAHQGRRDGAPPAEGRRNGAPPAHGRRGGVLFLLMNPQARRFVPNLHTDPAFTSKLIDLRDKIWMRAVSIRTTEDGSATVANPDVPIDLEAASVVQADSGAYLLIVALQRQCRFVAGTAGQIQLEPGWYVYAGSGRKNLSARIARHHRRRKKAHWHIDFLLDCVPSGNVKSLPIRSRHDLECTLAREIAAAAAGSTPRFGCSDCGCSSHLLHFDSDPLQDRRFLDLLLHYRHTVALDRSS